MIFHQCQFIFIMLHYIVFGFLLSLKCIKDVCAQGMKIDDTGHAALTANRHSTRFIVKTRKLIEESQMSKNAS